ncbi:MAG: VTT domain-containing protein [Romboutsia timonensis]
MPKTKKSIKASYYFLQKYDKISVLLSRLIPLARTFISIIAGVIRMNIGTFTIYSSLGILIWNSVLISAGYIVSDNIEMIGLMISRYSILIMIIGLIGVAIYIYIMKIKSRNIEDECSTGEEISIQRIYLASPHIGDEEMKYIQQAFDTNWVAPLDQM